MANFWVAHKKCNRSRRNFNFFSDEGLNLQSYDLHHICLALKTCEPTTIISVIPSTEEMYISMTLGVLIDTFVNEKGTTLKVYEYLWFIDSFKMMNSSRRKVEEILLRNKFKIMKSMFLTVPGEKIQLLKQKRYYLYSYMSSRVPNSPTHN